MNTPIKIGVSACLLGEYVRYDGGHKHDSCIIDVLGTRFVFVPVCPEVGSGLPIPREAMRLEGDPAAPRLMTRQTHIDKTGQLHAFCAAKTRELENEDICGFVFKERSPSCGLTAVPLHGSDTSERFAVGLFAREVICCFPLMPLVEAERLGNPGCRENFIEQVILYRRAMDVRKYESFADLPSNNNLKSP